MIRKLIFVVFLLVNLLLGTFNSSAGCTTDPATGWWGCKDENGNSYKPTCADIPGGCGTGTGCIDTRFGENFSTGCYNCAAMGDCGGGGTTSQGNSCPIGYVYSECATGTNTCIPGEKYNACKTGSNTITNCRQVRDSCPRYSAGNDCRDCLGGYEPNWWNNCQQSRQVPDTCYQGWNCYMVPNCQEVGGHWEERCWRADCWDVWVPDVICSGDRQQCDPYGAYPCTRTECTGGGWEQGACRQWGDWHQCFQGDPCYDSGSTHTVCDGSNTCAGGYSWDNCANNGTNTCQGGCVPVPCNSVAPSVPTLQSPVGNANVSGTVATLQYNTAGFGTPCAGGNVNRFNIYVNQCDALTPATTLWKTTANTSEVYTGQGGKGYCWSAEATNGVTTSARSATERWNFSDQPWWQVSGGGVMAQGGISSKVNNGKTLIKDAPAVLVAGGTVDLNGQQASSTNWQANDPSAISTKLNYRYDYIEAKSRVLATIRPANLSSELNSQDQLLGGSVENGVSYFLVNGNLNVNIPLDLTDQKIVILVDGDVTINKNINFTDNVGLFALLAKGDINIDPGVGTDTGTGADPETLPVHLEGIFLAGRNFNSGTGAKQLRIEGPVIGMSSVNFQRRLNSAWPNEYVVFRPDIILNLPKQLLRQNHLWREALP